MLNLRSTAGQKRQPAEHTAPLTRGKGLATFEGVSQHCKPSSQCGVSFQPALDKHNATRGCDYTQGRVTAHRAGVCLYHCHFGVNYTPSRHIA